MKGRNQSPVNNALSHEKHRWIAELVANRTFADVGGLWNTVNETVSVAMLNGASEATMIDVMPSGHNGWKLFHERCESLGVSGYRSVQGDITSDRIADEAGSFDVTHCSGVLYHVPNPFHMIRNLISITREWFVLSSMVVPERIENRFGRIQLAEGQLLAVPLLSDLPRRVMTEYFRERKMNVSGLNVPSSYLRPNGAMSFTPWWWLFTSETLAGMCELFGVDVRKQYVNSFGSASVLARIG